MIDLPKHHFVPKLTDPDRCVWSLDERECNMTWNNYVAHFQEGDGSRRPESFIEITADKDGITITDQRASTSDRPTLPVTPELDKMQNVKHESQPIGEFLEWLNSEGVVLAKYDETVNSWQQMDGTDLVVGSSATLMPTYDRTENLLARYFEIDLKKVEEERRAVLDYIRSRDKSTSDGAS